MRSVRGSGLRTWGWGLGLVVVKDEIFGENGQTRPENDDAGWITQTLTWERVR